MMNPGTLSQQGSLEANVATAKAPAVKRLQQIEATQNGPRGSIQSSDIYFIENSGSESVVDVDSSLNALESSAAEAVAAQISAVDDLDDEQEDRLSVLQSQKPPKAIPKRLSDAFQGELSDEFLMYLNLKAELDEGDEASPMLDAANFDFEITDADTDALSRSSSLHQLLKQSRGGSMTVLETLDRERIRRTSSVMRANRSQTVTASSAIAARRDINNSRKGSLHVPDFNERSGTQEHLTTLQTIRDGKAQATRTTIIGPDERMLADELKEGDLATFFKARRELRLYRRKLSEQCEVNFRLERNLRTLDENIGLLIRHRITVEDIDSKLLNYDFKIYSGQVMTERKSRQYGALFYILQNEPKVVAQLARQLSISEIDDFLQTIMFTLFGHFEPREEHMLLSMFEHALSMEFDAATDLGSVMRSNSAMSRMMTTYTRRGLGQQYLKDVLTPQVELIYELNTLSLEIDPVKVFKEIAKEHKLDQACCSAEDALRSAPVQEAVESRARALRELSSRFINAIIDKLEAVPYGLRWLCKSIRTQLLLRFPSASREALVSLIGGFMLLRYINPAIISPEAFAICPRKPSTAVRRNLTQIAKILQSIANGAKVGSSLSALGDFMKVQRERLGKFLLELCEVDDFYDEHRLEKISALAKLNNTISITPNEIYSVHTVLTKYRAKLEFDNLPGLSMLLEQLGAPPAKISREHNVLVELQLNSPTEPNVRRGSSESVVSASPHEERLSITEKEVQRVQSELERTKSAFDGTCEIFALLTEKIETYQTYLENVRGQSVTGSSLDTEYVSVEGSRPTRATRRYQQQNDMLPKGLGPFHYKLTKLDREGVVLSFNDEMLPALTDPQRANMLVVVSMPTVGHMVMSVRPKNRAAIYHNECKFEDLLTKVEDERPVMRLGDVLELDARRMLVLLDKTVMYR
eukprot:TRINITY_DN8934_c0_g1_i1.p1 TRINITY_DN8934_c0_g1~~TRINITY_DN8934_c0_g1_i1.p1  ORF type:complete len:926 (+),score=256.63 TRINITY_DN8934_c0_g1_i1:139-2916(+)